MEGEHEDYLFSYWYEDSKEIYEELVNQLKEAVDLPERSDEEVEWLLSLPVKYTPVKNESR